MLESVSKTGTTDEWRRWMGLVTVVFFALILIGTVLLVYFGDNVFL